MDPVATPTAIIVAVAAVGPIVDPALSTLITTVVGGLVTITLAWLAREQGRTSKAVDAVHTQVNSNLAEVKAQVVALQVSNASLVSVIAELKQERAVVAARKE